MIFDYPENSLEPEDVTMLGNKYGVFIAVRQKARQSTLCVVIKGVEKFVGKYYHYKIKIERNTKNTCNVLPGSIKIINTTSAKK